MLSEGRKKIYDEPKRSLMLASKLKLLEEDLKMWNRGCLVIGNMMYRISRMFEGIKEFDVAEAEAIHRRRVGW